MGKSENQSGVLSVGISDHLITYCTGKVNRAPNNTQNTVDFAVVDITARLVHSKFR